MAFTPEQIREIKKQIINQINTAFPDDKKSESIEKIEAMNDSEIIEFLEQNNMIRGGDSDDENPKCIFCSIISGEIPSTKIDEDENTLAILEINPLSEGHALIIPKNHDDKISSKTKKFSEEIKEKIKNALEPKEIQDEKSELFDHEIINLIPVYGDAVGRERKKSSPKELKEILEKINSSKKHEKKSGEEKEIPKEKKAEEKLRIPRRIP